MPVEDALADACPVARAKHDADHQARTAKPTGSLMCKGCADSTISLAVLEGVPHGTHKRHSTMGKARLTCFLPRRALTRNRQGRHRPSAWANANAKQTSACKCKHARARTHAHTQAHACARTHARAHTRARAHTHGCSPTVECGALSWGSWASCEGVCGTGRVRP
jgi:hypothetical protein